MRRRGASMMEVGCSRWQERGRRWRGGGVQILQIFICADIRCCGEGSESGKVDAAATLGLLSPKSAPYPWNSGRTEKLGLQ
jgi:hypothetical protein